MLKGLVPVTVFPKVPATTYSLCLNTENAARDWILNGFLDIQNLRPSYTGNTVLRLTMQVVRESIDCLTWVLRAYNVSED